MKILSRAWIIKNFSHSWDSKVFGTKYKHLRAVNITMPVFCICIAIQVTLEALYNVDFLNPWALIPIYTPFLICVYIGFNWFNQSYFEKYPSEFSELDWEQQWQHLNLPQYLKQKKNDYAGHPYANNNLYQLLEDKYSEKYGGRSKFVEAWRFFKPLTYMAVVAVYSYIIMTFF